ncbi:MAG: glycosyltransferase [Candidatus Moranbacteria bacterium]|jgi:glycosyltransferase involved in cell wall biosynthesis|nr:glycosyltransferase [Candidatus Moranbacteria bacterium]
MVKSQEKFKDLKVALVHDFLDTYGGAERVLEVMSGIFPQAPIYTLIYDKEKMRGKFESREIHTSFLQKFPKFLKKRKKYLLPFMAAAPETFDLRDFDLVISSSGAWSKGIVTRLNTKHICYMHSPMRFVWDYNEKYLQEIGGRMGVYKRMFLSYLRIWDFQAAQRPDILVANSSYTRERINKYYRRDAQVIFPTVLNKDNGAQIEIKDKDYFLVVSRLSAYKKVDLVVEAFNKIGLPLVIIGEGEEAIKLKKIAKDNIKILGWQDDATVQTYYKNARAFIFPAVDDFGLTMIEAMNQGVPVIAIGKGGAKEIVKEGITGELFEAQTIEVLADGIRRFMEKEKTYDKEIIKQEGEKFSQDKFKKELLALINEELMK